MAGRLANLLHSRTIQVGRWLARVACALFALVGALPILGALALQTRTAQDWIAEQTRQLLHEQLGIEANYTLRQRLWPLRITLTNLSVAANDGGSPAALVDEVVVKPNLLTLLGGRLEVGTITVRNPRARLVFQKGRLTNVSYRLPRSNGPSKPLERAPFSRLTVQGARVDLKMEGIQATFGLTDVDVVAGNELAFSTTLKIQESRFSRVRNSASATTGKAAATLEIDEDVLCSLEARIGYQDRSIQVDHLALTGLADASKERGTFPDCQDASRDSEQLVRVVIKDTSLNVSESTRPKIAGDIAVRGPAWLANRFATLPQLTGWAELHVRGIYDEATRLPQVSGQIHGSGLGLGQYQLAKHLAVTLGTDGDRIVVPWLELGIADGNVVLHDTVVEPLAPGVPAKTRLTETRGMTFPGLMRDLGVTEHTLVAWNFGNTDVTNLHGTIYPLHIDAAIEANTHGFQVFNRAWDDPARRVMIAVPSASVRARIGVRPSAFEIYNATTSFGQSTVVSDLVSIGFDNQLEVAVREGSTVELSNIGPLVGIPISGRSKLNVHLKGISSDPLLLGEISIDDFVFGGFPVGRITSSHVRFRPLWLEFENLRGQKGESTFHVPQARLDFDSGATVAVNAHVKSNSLDIRDFFAMWKLDQDPRWEGFEGDSRLDAQVRYTLGGPRDNCGNGRLEVEGAVQLSRLLLFGEHYDSGAGEIALDWTDRDASVRGFSLDMTGLLLRKGSGTLLGSFSVRPGAELSGRAVATAVPLHQLDSLGMLRNLAEGSASGLVEFGGTLEALEIRATASISPLRIGGAVLPASELRVQLHPKPQQTESVGISSCGAPIPPPFDLARYSSDPVDGEFILSGQLFGKQLAFDTLSLTQQRDRHLKGEIRLDRLDLGALAELAPSPVRGSEAVTGSLSGSITINDFAPKSPTRANVQATVSELWMMRGRLRLGLHSTPTQISLADGRLSFPELALGVSAPGEPATVFDVQGHLANLEATPEIDTTLKLRPLEVSTLLRAVPQIERAKGRITGAVTAKGPLPAIQYGGSFELAGGEFILKGLPWALTGVGVALALDDDQLQVVRGVAKVGSGTLALNGSASLDGVTPKDLRLNLTARGVHAPLQPGIEGTFDADLVATWSAAEGALDIAELPRITGGIDLKTFDYTRPVRMSVDIADLTGRGKRTEFDAYDPSADRVRFDVQLRSSRTLRIRNNLLDAELQLGAEGLQLQGTNQRVGLLGTVKVKPGGRIQLRSSEFEVRQGLVRFNDATTIAPQVDVTATTDYKRYSDSLDTTAGTSGGADTSTNATGGQWLITMHAHGDAEQLKIDLSSEPALAQDDIFLLLTVGVTRAELDQSQSASVGESVALEALGNLSGADRAVSEAIPVIDEFRFGSAYSSRAGRTEPTVTIGKRLAERIRASVTTGVAESREVRSKLEWRLSQRLSIEGSYDNVNDVSSSSLGNLGGDLRWRMEFE